MDDPDGTYAPESPDLSAYHQAPSYAADPSSSSSYHPRPRQQPQYQAVPHHPNHCYTTSPYFDPRQAREPAFGQQQQQQQPSFAGFQEPPLPGNADAMAESAGLRARGPPPLVGPHAPGPPAGEPAPVRRDVEVRTKFPVARIKRIMQADEDVGKVAQVTPVAVSKALELFMIALVSDAADEAASSSSKRITAAHLKRTVEKKQQLDFLWDITSKVPDAPGPSEKADDGDDGEGRKRRQAQRKKRKDSEDF